MCDQVKSYNVKTLFGVPIVEWLGSQGYTIDTEATRDACTRAPWYGTLFSKGPVESTHPFQYA